MNNPSQLIAICNAHQQAQSGAAGAVNRHLILRNWVIGAYLVEYEQNGEDRAQYGAALLNHLAADLRQRGIPGTSSDMLERMRLFYIRYPQLGDRISAPLVRKLPPAKSAVANLLVSVGTHPPRGTVQAGFLRKNVSKATGPCANFSARSVRSSTSAPAFPPTIKPLLRTPARKPQKHPRNASAMASFLFLRSSIQIA